MTARRESLPGRPNLANGVNGPGRMGRAFHKSRADYA